MRGHDRNSNSHRYPLLNYPELYILEGGYKAFYEQYQVSGFTLSFLLNRYSYSFSCGLVRRNFALLTHIRQWMLTKMHFASIKQSKIEAGSPTGAIHSSVRDRERFLVAYVTLIDQLGHVASCKSTFTATICHHH